MVVSDVSAILVAAIVASFLAALLDRTAGTWSWWLAVGILVPVWLLIGHASGLYRMSGRRIHVDLSDEIGPTLVGITAWTWCFALVWSLLEPSPISLLATAIFWTCTVVLILAFRSITRALVVRFGWNERPVAVIGGRQDALAVVERIWRHPEWSLDPVVMMTDGGDCGFRVQYLGDVTGNPVDPEHVLDGGTAEMAEIAVGSGAQRAFLAGGASGLRSTTELIQELIERGCTVDFVSGGAETLYSTAVLQHLEGMPTLTVAPTSPGPIASLAKRAIDVVVASMALLLSSPILAWAAIRIKLDSPGPVFFRQDRPGRICRSFTILKLRTMEVGAEDKQAELRRKTLDERGGAILFKLEDDPRVTSFGKKLRRWSLDELPQLWNVLRGDMSIVGPRPVLFEETDLVSDRYSAREMMKPGICGPWQALGRSDIPFEDMVRLDYTYVVGWSLSEDLRLMLRTALVVAGRKGAY